VTLNGYAGYPPSAASKHYIRILLGDVWDSLEIKKCLDPVAPVPAATSPSTIKMGGTAVRIDKVDANYSTSEPKDERKEREGNICLPSLACSILGDIAPVPDAPTVHRADEAHKQAKCNNPSNGEDKIDWPVDDSPCEREEPQKGE